MTTKKTIEERIEEAVNKYWNEHDGDHFYKDELKELITSLHRTLLEERIERVRGKKVIGITAEECKCCFARNQALTDIIAEDEKRLNQLTSISGQTTVR